MASYKKILFTVIALISLSVKSNGQETLDKIIAVIGKNRIILQSDMELQLLQMKEQKVMVTDSIKCSILQQMILQKMFAEQADRDSLIVSDDEVENKLENRIRYFVNMYGSKEKLEEALGKTTYQLKDENRDLIKEQMMAERMQSKVMGNISVTPSEVRAFFNQIPKDSLPFFPATVELGQIIIAPYTSKELDQYAKEKLTGIRNQIVNEGKSLSLIHI
jgi:peptidyl-prolyl cis-trans isomerase SurA